MVDAALVTPACETGVEEGEDTCLGHVASKEPAAEREHVRVVVLPGKLGREGIIDTGTSTLRFAVYGNRDADAGAAHGDATLDLPCSDRPGQARAIFWIIDALRPVRAEVANLVALLAEPASKLVLQKISRMIGGKGNAHVY